MLNKCLLLPLLFSHFKKNWKQFSKFRKNLTSTTSVVNSLFPKKISCLPIYQMFFIPWC